MSASGSGTTISCSVNVLGLLFFSVFTSHIPSSSSAKVRISLTSFRKEFALISIFIKALKERE